MARDLKKENRNLRIRLEEAEELLAAIRSGSVDAFITDDEKIFTLEGADRPYRVLTETMNEGAVTLAADGTVMYCNRRFSKMLALPNEKIVGKPIFDFVDAEQAPRLRATLRRSRTRTARAEFRFKKGRDLIPVIVSCGGLKLDVTSLCMVVTDLSRQKRTELELEKHRDHLEDLVEKRARKLKRSEEILKLERNRLRATIDTTPVGIAVTDARGGNIFSNAQFEEIWGKGRVPARGVGDYRHYRAWWADSGETVKPEEWASAQVIRTGKPAVGQLMKIRRFGGGSAYVINSAAPIFDARGKIAGTVVALVDVTERRRMDMDLAIVAAKYASIFNTTSDGVWIHNLKGEIVEVNDAYCRMSGYTRDELIHMPVSRLEAEETPREVEKHIRRVVREGHDRFESRHRGKDGSEFDVDITALYLERDGGQIAIFVRDITSRKKLEALLQSKFREQQTILDSSPTMIFFKDRENRFIRVNRAMGEAMGVQKEQLEGKSVHDVFPQPQAESYWSDDLEVMTSGLPKRGIIEEMSTPKGKRVVETDKVPYVDEKGEITGVIGFAVDITERRLAERALLWGAKRHELISVTAARLLQSGDPQSLVEDLCRDVMEFLECDTFFNFLWDERAGRLHLNARAGIPDEEAARLEWLDLGVAVCGCVARDKRRLIAEDIQHGHDPRTALVKTYGIQAYCCHPLMIQGRLIGTLSFGTRSRPRFTSDEIGVMEAVSNLVAIAMNRIATEDELRRSRQDLERAQLVGSIGNWRLDVPSDTLSWSDETYRIFGIPRGTPLTYAMFLSRVHPDDRDFVQDRWKASLAGEDYDIEHRIIADGVVKWIREKAFIEFDGEGVPQAGFGISQDITVRKEAEQVLRRDRETFERLVRERTDQLVEAQLELERAKHLSNIGALAATIAHELRNPLAAIGLAAHNVQRKAGSPEIEKHLQNIAKKVAESDQIIDNLLFYSRLKPPSFEPVKIHEILEESVEATGEKFKKNVAVARDIEVFRDMSIEADPTQMREVFNNVLSNAFDAVPSPGGEIRVAGEVADGFITLFFEDNGPGIADDIIDNIFDPFFTTKVKGTGLGLSVCRQIVVMHGGVIGAEAGRAQGARIFVRLPRTREKKGDGAPAKRSDRSRGPSLDRESPAP